MRSALPARDKVQTCSGSKHEYKRHPRSISVGQFWRLVRRGAGRVEMERKRPIRSLLAAPFSPAPMLK
jgi:hypothetical protein